MTNIWENNLKRGKGHAWWLTSVVLATWETETGRSWFEGQPGKIALETCLQNNHSRMDEGMAEAVEHLLCKFKVLSSNSSPYPTSPKRGKIGFGSWFQRLQSMVGSLHCGRSVVGQSIMVERRGRAKSFISWQPGSRERGRDWGQDMSQGHPPPSGLLLTRPHLFQFYHLLK
jgi:hypothetical protein